MTSDLEQQRIEFLQAIQDHSHVSLDLLPLLYPSFDVPVEILQFLSKHFDLIEPQHEEYMGALFKSDRKRFLLFLQLFFASQQPSRRVQTLLASYIKFGDEYWYLLNYCIKNRDVPRLDECLQTMPVYLSPIEPLLELVVPNTTVPIHSKAAFVLAFIQNCPIASVPLVVAATKTLLEQITALNIELNETAFVLSLFLRNIATRQFVMDWIVQFNLKSKIENVIMAEEFPASITTANDNAKLFPLTYLLIEADMLSDEASTKVMNFMSTSRDVANVQLLQFATIRLRKFANAEQLRRQMETFSPDMTATYLSNSDVINISTLKIMLQVSPMFFGAFLKPGVHSLLDECLVQLIYQAVQNNLKIPQPVLEGFPQYAYQNRPLHSKYLVARILQHQNTMIMDPRVQLLLHFLPFFKTKCKCFADVQFIE